MIFSLAFDILHRGFCPGDTLAVECNVVFERLLGHSQLVLLLVGRSAALDDEQADDHDDRGAECVEGIEEGRSVERGDDFKDAAVAK